MAEVKSTPTRVKRVQPETTNKSTNEEKVQRFPSEVIDLPSGGKVYGKQSPLLSGQIERKYMTAKEEDILTSQNLIKKGVVIDQLLNSLIITPGVSTNDLILGDKNAVMVAARILAYGPEYSAEIQDPTTGDTVDFKFDLSDCPFKPLPNDVNYSGNKFKVFLPTTKTEVEFKLLTGSEEKEIERELLSLKKTGSSITPELTTRLKYCIISINGDTDNATIRHFVDNELLSRDSIILRREINRISPDIQLTQDVEIGGELVTVDIPMTVNFFWPSS